MKIGFNITPLKTAHAVRGVGMYTKLLKEALLKYYPNNEYIFLEENRIYENKADIIHYPFFDPFSLSLPWRKVSKTVVTIHDLIPLIFPNHFPAGIRGRAKWEAQKILLNSVDGVITDSESSKKDIVTLTKMPNQKVHVVYLAAGEAFKKLSLTGKEKELIKRKFNLPDSFALYVGDATWNKNLPRIMEAFEKLNLPLVLVGKAIGSMNIDEGNPWNKDLIKVHQKIDNKKFISLGFIEEADLVKLYNLAEVLVSPSLYEGFGLPILEAMSCGCPVVTSLAGSLSEVAGDAAFFVNPESTEEITQGVEKILQDKKLRNVLIEKGLQNAEKFSWKKTATETVKVYETLTT